MKQLELEMFFPLTEQIPLDLVYTDCYKPKLMSYQFTNVPTSIVTFTSPILTIDVQSTTLRTKTKPPLYRRALYRLLGLKWETK